jgi:TolB protein
MNMEARLSGWQRAVLFVFTLVVSVFVSGCVSAQHSDRGILFDSAQDGRGDIYVMHSDGSNWRRLTFAAKGGGLPQWSPDRRRIVFVSTREGDGKNVYIMNADGSNVVRLTNHKDDDDEPSWSPDAAKIVFESNRDGNSEIYVMNVDGSGVQRLTWSDREGSFPCWSPDGTRIVFGVDDGLPSEAIFVMNSDGSAPRLVGAGAAPRWSPDGKRILFISRRDGDGDDRDHDTEIYVMNSDGSGVQRLTRNRSVDAGHAWSPDGTQIVFHSDRDGESGRWGPNLEIYVMNADGSQTRRLTFNKVFDAHPDW